MIWNFVGFSNEPYIHSQVQSPLEQFVALSMYKGDGSFHSAIQLTHLIADLQYSIRVATIYHYGSLARDKKDEILAETSSYVQVKQAVDSIFDLCFEPLHNDRFASPLATLCEWKRLGFSVLANDHLPDPTFWVDSSHEVLNVDNHTISISGIRTALQSASQYLDKQLLAIVNGCNLPPFNPAHLVETPRNNSPGFNYLAGSIRNLGHTEYFLLSNWMAGRDPQGLLAPNWRETVGHDPKLPGNVWNPSAAWKWLAEVDKYLDLIYFLYHVGCGQPARGREESLITTCNLESAPRNIYWRSTRFLIQTWYHKGQNITNRSKPRQVYLTPLLSIHLHRYLAYIRPIQL